ncbi:MAG: 4-hydroxy-3-methylbut-2-enyl diphosphate reductase [bacterium]
MQVFLPPEIGFCFGVKRALRLVTSELKKARKIYALGDLIHNPQVIEDLKRKGVVFVSNLSQAKGGPVIIRSHGVDQALIRQAKESGLKVIDATCPYVAKVQKIAKFLSQKSYRIVIVGLSTHPEIKGVMASVGEKKTYVVKDPQQIKKIPFMGKIGVVAQTTESLDNFSNIVKNLVERGKECRVFNTICKVIRRRQEETKELAKKVETVVVVGGHNSSNTSELARLSQSMGVKTYFVEKEEDLNSVNWQGIKRVGITGGTSTPEELIIKIKNRFDRFSIA